jgi:hypothetical protein
LEKPGSSIEMTEKEEREGAASQPVLTVWGGWIRKG